MMQRLVSSWLMFLFIIASPSSLADNTQEERIAAISRQMQKLKIIEGQFNQTRTVANLNQPLTSSGRFTFWKNQGIYWQTDHPYAQATTFSNDRTIAWLSPGIPAKKNNNSQRDKHFRRILLALFSFDQLQLQQQFDTHWEISDHQWQLTLSPKDKMSRYALTSASLVGDDYIQHIDIISAKGEKLAIDFFNIQPLNHSGQNLHVSLCVNLFGYNIDSCKTLTQPDQQP